MEKKEVLTNVEVKPKKKVIKKPLIVKQDDKEETPEAPKETKEGLEALSKAIELDQASFDKKLISLTKKANSVQDEIQDLALSAYLECAKTKNAQRINALIKAMPDSLRKNELRAHAERFSPIKWDSGSKQFAYDKSKSLKLWEANQKPWFKMTQEKPYIPYDFIGKLEALVDQAGRRLSHKKDGDLVSPEQVNKLASVLREFKEKLAA